MFAAAVQCFEYKTVDRHSMLPRATTCFRVALQGSTHAVQCTNQTKREEEGCCWEKEGYQKMSDRSSEVLKVRSNWITLLMLVALSPLELA